MATREKEDRAKEQDAKKLGANEPGDRGQGDKEHGEGNYKASRDYNERTKRFMESKSSTIDETAHNAAPRDSAEASDLENAERIGKSRAKEEDPALAHGKVAPVGGERKRPANRRGK